MEREVRQGREEGEEQGGERVGEEGGAQRSGGAEEGNYHEGPAVECGYYAQGTNPLGLGDAARVADFARARQEREVDEREPTRQE